VVARCRAAADGEAALREVNLVRTSMGAERRGLATHRHSSTANQDARKSVASDHIATAAFPRDCALQRRGSQGDFTSSR
jgi:hypothetical protein